MSTNGYLQITLYIGLLLLLAKPLGVYMARVYEGRLPRIVRRLAPVENFCYRLFGIDPAAGMRWSRYAIAALLFSLIGIVVVYALQRLQGLLPLNPQGFGAVTPDSSFNTAVSFVSNTNWQGYGGEATMSYLTQMVGLGVQNFVSAATGMAVVIALIRGFAGHTVDTIGNFWVDLTRSTIYVLLPLSFILALLLVSQGVVQNFAPYVAATTIESVAYEADKVDANGRPVLDATGTPARETVTVRKQSLPMGPAASQIAIKQLGTNGGGFFNVNSAHPYENPTPLSNFLQLLAILLIPAALACTFGEMVGDRRQGRAILATMTIVFMGFLAVAEWAEQAGNPAFTALGVDQQASAAQSGGNMEGKEVRFGIVNSALWATATTAASNGSVNAMHDSFTPLGGLVPLALIQLGEVIFGGVGSGLYGMLVFALIAVFIAGLMIGRTPEYLGKKIEAYDIKMASLVILIPPLLILGLTALALMSAVGRATIFNPGAHGFSEVLYAYSSAAGNNGSAFGGLGANTPFYNTTLGLAMFVGRFWLMVPVLALAGSLAAKKRIPAGAGTMETHTPLFVMLLTGTVILVGALTFVPALALGPVVEHLIMVGP